MLGIAPTAVPMLSPVLLGVSIAFGAPCRARLALVINNSNIIGSNYGHPPTKTEIERKKRTRYNPKKNGEELDARG